jgi:hypothetical protein
VVQRRRRGGRAVLSLGASTRAHHQRLPLWRRRAVSRGYRADGGGQRFQALNGHRQALDSAAISLSVSAVDAADIDHYWQAISADGGRERRCGWLTDWFGISWQVVPEGLGAVMSDPDPARTARAMAALMTMGKLDLAALRVAAAGAST